MRRKIIVLKFGSSVLRTPADLPQAVHEIYRWVRLQYQVVAVVSAFNGETDRLLKSIEHYGNSQPDSIARVVATGEEVATASLALELDRFGIPAQVLDAGQIQLVADGCGSDCEPIRVDEQRVYSVLNSGKVAVIPGFIARDARGHVALLGRGGSDLSALFLAKSLNATCRLIKDVDGIYNSDPATSPAARRFDELTFVEALSLGAKIVQGKAIAYAEKHGIEFEVAKAGAVDCTTVGARRSALSSTRTEPRPLKIGLLGLGTVGFGVFKELWKQTELFDVTGIAVRRPDRHLNNAPEHLLTSDCWDVVDDADVLVELIGGVDPALDLVQAALAAGKSVVTANKLLLAENRSLSRNSKLRYSAAVGGAVPALEAVNALADKSIASISGVLNGTCNFILDRIAAGAEFLPAVAEAQARGFAEQDPRADLSGSDTVCKLQLLAGRAFPEARSISVSAVGIDDIDADWVRSTAENGGRVRLVGTAFSNRDAIELNVHPQQVSAEHPFAQIKNEENCLVIHTNSSSNSGRFQHTWAGRGAGRWPTTAAVMADLFDLSREYQNSPALATAGGVA
jgi:homoserine dehydrogenase